METKKKRGREGHQATYLTYLAPTYLAQHGPAHLHFSPCRLPPPRPEAARWRAPESSGHLLLTCSPLEAPEGATHSPSPPAPPLSSPGPRSLLCFPPAHTTERSSPSSSPYPWPPATPSLADAPGSSAGPPSASPPIHSPPEALHRRHRRRLLPQTRRPSSSNSPAPDRLRPRRAFLVIPVSPCYVSPLSPLVSRAIAMLVTVPSAAVRHGRRTWH